MYQGANTATPRKAALESIRGRRCAEAAAAVAVLLLLSAGPLTADRILSFSGSTGSIEGVPTAEISADGLVVMRLRSTVAEGLAEKAGIVAGRLNQLALRGLTPGDLAVEQVQGRWALTGAGSLIITADLDTALATGLSERDLCESWRSRLGDVLREPYLAIDAGRSLLVPLGETRDVRFGGSLDATPGVSSSAPEVASAQAGADGRITIRGSSIGTAVLTIRAGAATHALTVEVKRWAARVARTAVLRVAGSGPAGPMAEAAVLNAALRAAHAHPRAAVRLSETKRSERGWDVELRAGGVDFIPVSGTVSIVLKGGLPPVPAPDRLLLSNYPEKVVGVGALMRQELALGQPTRLMWHHKNDAGRDLVLAVRFVNGGDAEGRLRTGWASAGPDPDEIFVGFNAMLRYWQTVRAGAGFELHLPPQSIFETVATPMKASSVVSGLMDLIPDAGRDLYVEVIARDPEDEPSGFSPLPSPGDPLPVTPYGFPATLDHELDYEVGGPFAHLTIGRDEVVNDEGIALAGAYGITHRVRIRAANPTDRQARVELALRAGGGVARVVALIDGEMVTSQLLDAAQEKVLARRELAAGATRELRMELIPPAGSNLPFTLVVRARTP